MTPSLMELRRLLCIALFKRQPLQDPEEIVKKAKRLRLCFTGWRKYFRKRRMRMAIRGAGHCVQSLSPTLYVYLNGLMRSWPK
jgi:hypothetical protein